MNARRAWHDHITGVPGIARKRDDAELEKVNADAAASAAGWDQAAHFGGIEVTRKY